MIRFFLDGKPTRPNAQRREHWAVRAREAASLRRDAAFVAGDAMRRAGLREPIDPAALFLSFVLARATGDLDGLVAAAKPYVDGLKDAGLLRDDNVARLPVLVATWSRGTREGVWISVRPASEVGR